MTRRILVALPTSDSPDGDRGPQENSSLVEEAVRRARQGDPEGMHFLYVRFAPDVQRYVAGLVNDPREVEDITEAVFAGLPTSLGDYRQREGPFEAWILRVARDSLR